MAWEAAPEDLARRRGPFQPRDPRASCRSPQTARVVAHRKAASDMPSPSSGVGPRDGLSDCPRRVERDHIGCSEQRLPPRLMTDGADAK